MSKTKSKPKLYLDSGYVDMPSIIHSKMPWCIVWGGRGTGKTYGALQCAYDEQIPFAYIRRTQTQADLTARPEFSPFRDLMQDREKLHIVSKPIAKGIGGFFNGVQDDKGNWVPDGDPIGVSLALSTIANIRGFSGRWLKLLIYDEFIPEPHERPLKHEFEALLNAYETINRNRELQGEPPCKMVMLSNSNDINNPVFEGLDIVKRVRLMRRREQEMVVLPERGLALYGLDQSPISARKAQTTLYRLQRGGHYAEMALANTFAQDSGSRIESRSLSEYAPSVSVGKVCVYTHKTRTEYYVCRHVSGTPAMYLDSRPELKRFKQDWSHLWQAYLRNWIVFEDETSEHLFRSIWMA